MDMIDPTQQMKIGGGEEEEDLYFIPSDDDEEEENKEMKERDNTITIDRKNDNKTLIETKDNNTIADDKEREENTVNISARDNNNIVSDKKEESIKPQDESTRNKEKKKARQTRNNTKEGTTSVKEKMTVTQENLPFGHICDDIAIDDTTQYVRLYCQNVSGIFDRDGIGFDSAFKEIKEAGADIFTFNETHGDESNATARRALRMSKQRMWRDNNEECKIVHSSSTAPVLTFTKPGGNLLVITGSLVGRVRDTITDPYG
jgi:hypothetical protein